MYTIDVSVKGTAPLIQHRFPMPDLETMSKGGSKTSGAKDYTQEWIEYFYLDSKGQIYQPANHFEGAMVKAAVNFKITGKRGKTYKDLFKAAVYVQPDNIPHEGFFFEKNGSGKNGVYTLDNVSTDADDPLYLDMRPVVVQRARVVRIRPTFKPGWTLDFEIECLDEQLDSGLIQDVLTHAGKQVGIGDYRPRFGRFDVVKFEVHD